MDYAFSHCKNDVVTAEEFMKLQGDVGYLIGRNLVTCAECRAKVVFKRGSSTRKAHFAHYKFNEKSEACSRRIGEYTPDVIRRVRTKASRYSLGYWQQRYEYYIFHSLLDVCEKGQIPLAVFKQDGVTCCYVNEENRQGLFQYLIGSVRLIQPIYCPRSDHRKPMKAWKRLGEYFCLMSQFIFENADKYEYYSTNVDKRSVEGLNIFESTVDRDGRDKSFCMNILSHLKESQSFGMMLPLVVASLHIQFSTRLFHDAKPSDCIGDNTFKEIAMMPLSEVNKATGGFDEFANTFEYTHTLSLLAELYGIQDIWTLCTAKLLHMEKYMYEGQKRDGFDWMMYNRLTVNAWVSSWSVFELTDMQKICRQFYGDDRNSPAEQELLNYDKKRGFIYVATIKGMEGLWSDELASKGYESCVKVGYSDDPDRRKKEIAGQIAPPEAVDIVAVFPVMDMKGAEHFVHRKLKRWRLSNAREVFGLTADDAEVRVGNLVREYQQSETTPDGGGFGKKMVNVNKRHRSGHIPAGFSSQPLTC